MTAQVDGNPKGGDAKQGSGRKPDSAVRRMRHNPGGNMTDTKTVAAMLTEAQRQWILSMPDGQKVLTDQEWEDAPDLFVQFAPDEYCPETGCYLGGGQRHWFAESRATSPDGASWHVVVKLNELGLAVRAHLQEQDHGQ